MPKGISPFDRVAVVDPNGVPLMPTKFERALKWIRLGKAKKFKNKFGIFCVKLCDKPVSYQTQKISLGIDPGKRYTGIGVQTKRVTLFSAHVVLPDNLVKEKKSALDSKRKFELWITDNLAKIFPITNITYEWEGTEEETKTLKKTFEKHAPTSFVYGYVTADMRTSMHLYKQKNHKDDKVPATQAVDGVAISCYPFVLNKKGKNIGNKPYCKLTIAPFVVIEASVHNSKTRRNPITVSANIRSTMNNFSPGNLRL